MIPFFVALVSLWRSLARAFRTDPEFRALTLLLLTLVAGATAFYRHCERWTVFDSLYFCVMTISTIGYGDLVPTTAVSKAFTIVYAILGIGLFVSFVSKLVVSLMQGRDDRKERYRQRRDAWRERQKLAGREATV